jgi:hypothetical protein
MATFMTVVGSLFAQVGKILAAGLANRNGD